MQRICPALIALVAVCLTGVAAADVSVMQDSCQVGGEFPIAFFSVENHDSTMPVCTVTLFPVDYASCFQVGCGAPGGWTCYPGNETNFYAADPAPGECMPAGTIKHGFSAALHTESCCFMINFLGPDNTMLGTQNLCFHCPNVSIEPAGWGHVKTLFQ
jgi:hypothetical protein